MNLKDINPNYLLENENLECKARLDRTNIIGWLKTIDGFANSNGGILLVGVEDKTNKLIGFTSNELDGEKMFFYNALNANMPILPQIKTEIIPYKIRDDERYLLKINISEGLEKPFILKYQGMPMVFIRRDGYTSAATAEELWNMAKKYASPSFDTQITDILFDINDFSDLSLFYKTRCNKEISEKELASIGFFNEKKLLTKGALLFKDKYNNEKELKVVCSTYQGLSKGDNKILSSESFSGNLISSYNFIWEYLQLRTNHGFIKKNTSREEIDAYPSRSLFEAIINALAHRDYLIENSQISVDLYRNRIVITSPGSMFGGKEIAPTYNISSFISTRRNSLICNVFVLAHAMEAKGTGLEKISEDYKNEDDRHKPFIFSKNNQFSIVLPDLTNEEGIDLNEESLSLNKAIANQSKYDNSILTFCFEKARSVNEICQHLGISNSTYFRSKVLDSLVSQSFLVAKAEGNKKLYTANKDLVSIL